MANKRSSSPSASTAPVTADRAGRLYRLLKLLGRKPRSRDDLVEALGRGVRGFYRDLEALRAVNIEVRLEEGRYVLADKWTEAMARLPFPDPKLTLGEAMQLATGRTRTHRKLKHQVAQITRA
jgi:predicted DNA-binding transcriptional regulator YafY